MKVTCPKCKHKFNAKQSYRSFDINTLEGQGRIVDAQFEEAWNNQVGKQQKAIRLKEMPEGHWVEI